MPYDPHRSGFQDIQQRIYETLAAPDYEKLITQHAIRINDIAVEMRKLPGDAREWQMTYDNHGRRVWINKRTHREIRFQ